MDFPARVTDYITGEIEVQLAQEMLEQNMSAIDAIRNARGAIQRVNDDVAKTVSEVTNLEQQAKDMARSAVAAPLKEIGAVKAELEVMINEMAQITNGAPDGPLPGSENPSMSSDGQSTENPTQPQAKG